MWATPPALPPGPLAPASLAPFLTIHPRHNPTLYPSSNTVNLLPHPPFGYGIQVALVALTAIAQLVVLPATPQASCKLRSKITTWRSHQGLAAGLPTAAASPSLLNRSTRAPQSFVNNRHKYAHPPSFYLDIPTSV